MLDRVRYRWKHIDASHRPQRREGHDPAGRMSIVVAEIGAGPTLFGAIEGFEDPARHRNVAGLSRRSSRAVDCSRRDVETSICAIRLRTLRWTAVHGS